MQGWTDAEESEPVRLVEKHGEGKWVKMLGEGREHGFFGAANVNPDEVYRDRSTVSSPL